MDKKTKRKLSVNPLSQENFEVGTPVTFSYEVPNPAGGVVGKKAVGKVHSRQADGTYSIDLMNGARKNLIKNAKKCDPKLLELESKSEHGMITHKDAYSELHTANTMDARTKRKLSVVATDQAAMAAGTPVTFSYEVPNPAGGMVAKRAVGKIHSRQKDGTYTIDLMNGARKNLIRDAKPCDSHLLTEELQSEHSMITHKDAYANLHTLDGHVSANSMDEQTKRRLSVSPLDQKAMAAGTPVKFTYEVPNAAGGVVGKSAVGKVHSRQADGTYSVDLMNGARKANICDARKCDAKLLTEEYQSEHGMVTHKDALEYLHTANAEDEQTKKKMLNAADPKHQGEMATGTPVTFSYEVPNAAGGVVGKSAVGKVHSRQADGTYSVDLMNGARKANICDARKCDAKLLTEEYQSEHGMVTHKDALEYLHTANAEDEIGKTRFSINPMDQAGMSPGDAPYNAENKQTTHDISLTSQLRPHGPSAFRHPCVHSVTVCSFRHPCYSPIVAFDRDPRHFLVRSGPRERRHDEQDCCW
jgi:hypothetical protein